MKRYAKIAGGFTVLTAGVVMLALPGPGWLTIVIGLGILATEYVWARKALDQLKQTGRILRRSPRARPDTPASPDRSAEPE